MKKFVLVTLLAIIFFSCKKDETNDMMNSSAIEATILGRWQAEGFEDVIRYEFTANKRHTIYSTDGTFPTLEEFLAENPGLSGNDWFYSGDTIVVDLNFGNFSKVVPVFKCDDYVVDLIGEDGTVNQILFREGHDLTTCN